MSQLLFVLAIIPLTMLLKRENIGYKLGKDRSLINHLLIVDDLELYGRSEEELESLVNGVRVF